LSYYFIPKNNLKSSFQKKATTCQGSISPYFLSTLALSDYFQSPFGGLFPQ